MSCCEKCRTSYGTFFAYGKPKPESGPPPPDPDPLFQFEVQIYSRSSDGFDLEGYTEYPGHESTPPRYYGREVYDGHYVGSLLGPAWFIEGVRYSGEKVWPANSGGTRSIFYNHYDTEELPPPEDPRWSGTDIPDNPYESSYFWEEGPVPVALENWTPYLPNIDADPPVPIGEEEPVATITLEGNVHRKEGLEIMANTDSIARGYLERRLVDEYTPCQGLKDSVDSDTPELAHTWSPDQGPPPSATSSTIWIEGPTWEGVLEEWQITITGLVSGKSYRITWDEGSEPQEEVFEASGPTHNFSQTVPCGTSHTNWNVTAIDE